MNDDKPAMDSRGEFPGFVRGLPEADIPVEGLRGWLLQGENGQVLFLSAEADVLLPEHSHGDQWGFVVEGRIDLNIGGRERTLLRGDSYFIPGGTPHGGKIHTGSRAVDYFSDNDRYLPREGGG
jgi:quercetin dioxygenase-like cupin family protein